MIKLRLKRLGKKREASYRIVAMESSSRRDGRPLQELGFYNPRSDETRINEPEVLKWLNNGAQPTDTVRDILRRQGILGPNPELPRHRLLQLRLRKPLRLKQRKKQRLNGDSFVPTLSVRLGFVQFRGSSSHEIALNLD